MNQPPKIDITLLDTGEILVSVGDSEIRSTFATARMRKLIETMPESEVQIFALGIWSALGPNGQREATSFIDLPEVAA